MKRPYKSTSTSKKSPQNQLRIIGGKWRGQKLSFANAEGLRPTGDRIRETLFNWLAPVISGAHCLDLFAGSGALGIEALSRGALSATLIEKNRAAITLLHQSCTQLHADNADIVQIDALDWLNNTKPSRLKSTKLFDVVFLDPPFATELLQPCCDLLQQHGLLANNAYIYIETDSQHSTPVTPTSWIPLREKTSGQVTYRLYRCD
ncbi:MAG: 16S rRNA (guanine(966)-N(2))-methyltransferase RsmD [Porticoccus sp.]|nr:16S rRNA (guanine(966)-N(2))-methyltransferase RsmD [Porticoccus sp.]